MRFYGRGGDTPIARLAHEYEGALEAREGFTAPKLQPSAAKMSLLRRQQAESEICSNKKCNLVGHWHRRIVDLTIVVHTTVR